MDFVSLFTHLYRNLRKLRVSLIIVSPCSRVSACQSSDTWDIRDILDINDSGSLVSLNLAQNELGVEGAKHVAEVLLKW